MLYFKDIRRDLKKIEKATNDLIRGKLPDENNKEQMELNFVKWIVELANQEYYGNVRELQESITEEGLITWN